MVRILRRRRPVLIAVAVLVGAAGAVAIAAAFVPNAYTDATGAYRACITTKSGDVRMLLPGETCTSKEVLIDWNQVGQQGPAGPPGAPAGSSAKLRVSAGTPCDNATGGTPPGSCGGVGGGALVATLPGLGELRVNSCSTRYNADGNVNTDFARLEYRNTAATPQSLAATPGRFSGEVRAGAAVGIALSARGWGAPRSAPLEAVGTDLGVIQVHSADPATPAATITASVSVGGPYNTSENYCDFQTLVVMG